MNILLPPPTYEKFYSLGYRMFKVADVYLYLEDFRPVEFYIEHSHDSIAQSFRKQNWHRKHNL